MFAPIVIEAANNYSNTLRRDLRAVIRYEYVRPLDFVPGAKFSYSNFEYAVLGEVIATITKQKYADYVKKTLLEPLGLTDDSRQDTC